MQTEQQYGCYLNISDPFFVSCHHPASIAMDLDCTDIMGQHGSQGLVRSNTLLTLSGATSGKLLSCFVPWLPVL